MNVDVTCRLRTVFFSSFFWCWFFKEDCESYKSANPRHLRKTFKKNIRIHASSGILGVVAQVAVALSLTSFAVR
jgi:hypothetical protein